MANILTTIPKTKFKHWSLAEKVLKMCDGTTIQKGQRNPMFWIINTANLPTKEIIGSVCFMVFDGEIRGYMDIVDTDLSENWRGKHGIGKARNTKCIVMANWHPIPPVTQIGFQGWRYTELKP